MGSELPIVLRAEEDKHTASAMTKQTARSNPSGSGSGEVFPTEVTLKMTPEGEQQLHTGMRGMLFQVEDMLGTTEVLRHLQGAGPVK